MAEWLVEVFSEEIPSRMQGSAAAQLKSLTEKQLSKVGLSFSSVRTFVTPRRLTVVVEGLPLESVEKKEEKKGPLLTAPFTAIDGFLKTNGVKREDCQVKQTPKGDALFLEKIIPAQATRDQLPTLAVSLLKGFEWPKSMRWGKEPTPWIRPIRGLLSVFEGKVVPFTYAGIEASNITQGHRFMAPDPFDVTCFQDYETKLREHFVILDASARRNFIDLGIKALAQEEGHCPLPDEALLDEVTGLVEWPIVLKGQVDAQFMALPLEVITTPMRHHQRYFPFEDRNGNLVPLFGIVANIKAPDQGKTIVRGNERVLRARLADAEFFWEQDKKHSLEHFNEALKTRLFHQQLGSLFQKVERLEKLSRCLVEEGASVAPIVARAASLSKADLASHMVTEFPELQGTMGKYYARTHGEDEAVARAIEEHYWPKGAGGEIPTAFPSLILGIADRLDTLMGFFAIGITPTGSKDPFALRRAAFGLISLCLSPEITFSIKEALEWAYDAYPWNSLPASTVQSKEDAVASVWEFLTERLKFFLKDKQGSAHDHVDAVLSGLKDNSRFADLALRTQALDELMGGSDGQNLLNAYKRGSHILKIEEERDNCLYPGNVKIDRLTDPEEKVLFENLQRTEPLLSTLIEKGDFKGAVHALAQLRPIVDQFFDRVVVNVENPEIRKNRLNLLAFLRKILHQVADFSKIEG